MTPADPYALAELVAGILEKIGVRYVIGGSVAASLYGEPRSTLDLDVMIEADAGAVRNLVRELLPHFYVEEEDAVEAVRSEGSFNAIHLTTAMKVDFFIAEAGAGTRGQMNRRRAIDAGGRSLWFYSPEDILVRKLLWYRMGGEQSERQWRDILGILRVTGSAIDRETLLSAARDFGVEELLERAWKDEKDRNR
jgi:hypothetical protein